ncbi:universal stress protein [Streptomyces sp. NBC_00690]|uniref:universal stress protein n=1 Tax=Streptomyces sp. NBC_00690 TaxID=2975808 RepID=UPI002E2D18EB|nr:universal stress protein [Streptomyces sp. NBC_00690]
MTHHVAVGVDGSPEGFAAAEWAATEALLRDVPLRLVHVADKPLTLVVAALAIAASDDSAAGDALLQEAAANLRARHPALEVTTRKRSGRTPAALASEGDEAGLLVLGSRGLGSVSGFLVGSVGTATVGATTRPVVLVRSADGGTADAVNGGTPAPGEAVEGHTGTAADSGQPLGEVVVAVDVHDPVDAPLAFAFEEAARRGCKLRAVHGWRPPFVHGLAFDAATRLEVEREFTRTLRDLLLPWRQRYPSVKVVEEAHAGSAARAVLGATGDAALVVVGRRARRSPLGGHIGPVAHAVMHHATAPVAIIAHG